MTKQRVRIRFSKEGDLRLISHRDLARAWERLFRRSGLQLGMSEGFHPKARISFPSALGLGIAGLDEVVEVELSEQASAAAIDAALRASAPPGLSIKHVRVLGEQEKKAQVVGMVYEFPAPRERQDAVRRAIDELLAQDSVLMERDAGKPPVDIRASISGLELDGDVVRMRLLASRTASARPRDVLAAIGLADLENAGCCLTRTAVEISS